MISVKYSLRDKHSKRRSTIRTSVSYNGERIVFCPGYSICPNCWDYKSGLPKSIRGDIQLKTLTNNLKELDLNIRRLYDDLTLNGKNNISPDIFRKKILFHLHPEKHGEEGDKKISLIEFMDIFINDSIQGIRLKDNQYKIEENTIRPYRTTRFHLIGYQNKIKKKLWITDISQELQDGFSDYLTSDLNLSKNTHSKYIMILIQVIKYSVKKKLIPSTLLNEIEFNTSREETDSIYLNEQELQLLMNLKDFKSEQEEHVRDIFVLGCYTGLRFSNYSNLNLEHIKDGILTTIQIKTKQKISIPIHTNVRMIIDKYNGVLPKCPTNQEFNRTLKDIGKRIPEFHTPFTKQITRNRKKQVEETMKWEKITTHTARRSFCTNMYWLRVPKLTIMSISGHKTEKSFNSYIKVSDEEHALIMKNIWEEKTLKSSESPTP